MSASHGNLESGRSIAMNAVEKCMCVADQAKCCEEVGCGEPVPPGGRFFWVEENGGEEGDLEHRICRGCVQSK